MRDWIVYLYWLFSIVAVVILAGIAIAACPIWFIKLGLLTYMGIGLLVLISCIISAWRGGF